MDETLKQNIVVAMRQYMANHNLSQQDLERKTGVNVSYINALLAGEFTTANGAKIGDNSLKKIASAIGYSFERAYWKHVDTDQFSNLYIELMDSKAKGSEKIIIGESRCGKTYTLGMFKKKYPQHTYSITVSSLHNLSDVLDDICEQMGLDNKGNKVGKLRKISKKVRELKLKGKKPILIIDEAENLTLPALKMTKALYDAFADYCPIVLLGTKQLLTKLEKLKDDDNDGIPQLYYRFIANLRMLSMIEKDSMFAPFLDLVEDNALKVMLCNLAENYGMLNRYLEPALREADEMGEVLTEKFFMQFHKLSDN